MTNTIVQNLNHAAEAWWSFALHATWTSCLVAMVLLIMVRFRKRWPAKIRHAILLIALVKFALPPTLALPVGLFHWFGPNVVQNTFAASSAGAASILDGSDLSGKAWVFLVYSWGVIVAILMIVRQMIRVRRIVRGATVVTEGPVYERFVRLSRRLGFRRPIRLLATARPVAPMAFGLLRPSVLTPMSVHNRLDAGEVETVLAHELAHHRRGDLWVNWFQILLRIAWWFNPLLRVLNNAIRQVGEDCCDDLLLARRVTSGEGYCQALLRVARELGRQPMMRGALGFAESIHPLSRRMRRLMDPKLKRTDRLPAIAFAPIILIAAMVLPGLPSRAGSPVTMTATEVNKSAPLAQTDAKQKTSGGDSFSTVNTASPLAFAGSRFAPWNASAGPQYRRPVPRNAKLPATSPDDTTRKKNCEQTVADSTAVARSESVFTTTRQPPSIIPSTLGTTTQGFAASGDWYRWLPSRTAAPQPKRTRAKPQTPQPRQLELQMPQYADGGDTPPSPMRMPSLPGDKKLQTPMEQKTPQLADRSPKRLIQTDDHILAALSTSHRLNDAWLLGLDDRSLIRSAGKPIDLLRDSPAMTLWEKYDGTFPSVVLTEPLALAETPAPAFPMTEELATPIVKSASKITSTMEVPPYLPNEYLAPVSAGAPCAVPEPLSLTPLILGLTTLLRRRNRTS